MYMNPGAQTVYSEAQYAAIGSKCPMLVKVAMSYIAFILTWINPNDAGGYFGQYEMMHNSEK